MRICRCNEATWPVYWTIEGEYTCADLNHGDQRLYGPLVGLENRRGAVGWEEARATECGACPKAIDKGESTDFSKFAHLSSSTAPACLLDSSLPSYFRRHPRGVDPSSSILHPP